jgi:hypothetical protein
MNEPETTTDMREDNEMVTDETIDLSTLDLDAFDDDN